MCYGMYHSLASCIGQHADSARSESNGWLWYEPSFDSLSLGWKRCFDGKNPLVLLVLFFVGVYVVLVRLAFRHLWPVMTAVCTTLQAVDSTRNV